MTTSPPKSMNCVELQRWAALGKADWQKACVDLRPMETTNQDTFHQNVSVHRFHHIALRRVRPES